eukprot:evm.model.NODE_31236_length_39405_cov_67.395760.6
MGQLCERMMDLLSRRIEKRVVLLGLDNAGKTTCVYRLVLGKKIDTVPTIGFNSEEVHYNRCNFIMWDIGGQAKIRKLWKHYIESADALIFVVDSQDRARLKEARAAFKRMLCHKTLRNTVLLIYANKTDYEHSMTPAEIVEGLDVKRVVGDRKWFIQKTCAISGQGLREGLEWLSRALEIHDSSSSSSSSSSSCSSCTADADPTGQMEWEIGGGNEGEEGREEEMAGRVGTRSPSSSSMVVKESNCCGWGCMWGRREKRQQPAGSAGLASGPTDCPREPEEEATRRRRCGGQNGGGDGHRICHGSVKEGGKRKKKEEEGREGKEEKKGGREVVVMVHRQSKRHLMRHKQRKRVLSGMGEEEEEEEEGEEEEEDEEEEHKEKEKKEEEGGEEVKWSSSGGDEVKGGALLTQPPQPRIFTSNTTASAIAQVQMVG